MLSADFVNMADGIRDIEQASCKWVHLDIMDGKFVPPITFGHQMVKAIRKTTKLILDAHLMIDSPEKQIDFFADAGIDYLTVHLENTVHTHRILTDIQSRGIKAGIAIVPSTPISALTELLPFVDLVLVMTVNPGFGGQKLIPECVQKITQLFSMRKKEGYNYLISADGGINAETASMVRNAGLDVAVCGSSFFSAPDKKKFLKLMQGAE